MRYHCSLDLAEIDFASQVKKISEILYSQMTHARLLEYVKKAHFKHNPFFRPSVSESEN